MSIPEGYDCVCVECKSPFIYANRSRPSDRDVPLRFCSRRCWELAEGTPAGMSEPDLIENESDPVLLWAEIDRLRALTPPAVVPEPTPDYHESTNAAWKTALDHPVVPPSEEKK